MSYDDDENEEDELSVEEFLNEPDEIDHAIANCGLVDHGPCAHAGSEYCQFHCPFNHEGTQP